MSNSEPLVLRADSGRLTVVSLNRPDRRNALSLPLLNALGETLRAVDADPQIGAIVLTGAGGRVFSAGADLGQASGGGLLTADAGRQALAQVLSQMAALSKPVVGAALGPALAGGLGLLLACDLVLVTDSAAYGTPEVQRGLYPMRILPLLLAAVGRRRTLELTLTGAPITGQQLVNWGGANAAHPAAELMPAALALGAGLSRQPARALALGRQAVYSTQGLSPEAGRAHLESALAELVQTADAQEGVAAFFERRAPNWQHR